MEMGCGDSTKFPCLFQVFVWPRGSSAGLRQKQIPTLVKPWRDGAQLFVWGVLLLQNPLLKVWERNSCCSKVSKTVKTLVFFKTVASDLTSIIFSFITLGSRKWPVLHSPWSKDLCTDTSRRVSSALFPSLSSCPESRLANTHLSRPFPEAAEAQPAVTVLLAMWGCSRVALSDYSSGKSDGLSMFSVGNGLVWGFPTISLIPVVAQPPAIFC